MLRIVIVVWLAACDSHRPVAIENSASPPAANDPHASQDGLVRSVLAAALEGNAQAMLALARLEDRVRSDVSCPTTTEADKQATIDARRFELDKAVHDTHGVDLEVLAVERTEETVPIPVPKGDQLAPGGQLGSDCAAERDLVFEMLTVRVSVKVPGGAPVQSMIYLSVIRVAGRWFVESIIVGYNDVIGPVQRLETFTERMCACTSSDCARRVGESAHRWDRVNDELLARHGALPWPKDAASEKAVTDTRRRFAKCAARSP